MLWVCIIVIAGISALLYFIYSGLFCEVNVSVQENPLEGDLEILYKVGRGPHSSCSAYYEEMKELVPDLVRIGIFYDDPKIIRPSSLRWIVGVISSVNGQRLAHEYATERLVRYRFASLTIRQVDKAIVADHVYKNALSLWLAKKKLIPKVQQFQKYSALAGRPLIEILKEGRVKFIFPLDNHGRYMPPELRW